MDDTAVRLQVEDFSQDAEIDALRATSKRMGGIATFLGCARDFSEGREVSEISFDAYGSMALAELEKLRSEAIVRFGLLDARIVHRLLSQRAVQHDAVMATLPPTDDIPGEFAIRPVFSLMPY